MRAKLRDFFRGIPRWLKALGGVLLGFGLCYVAFGVAFTAYWTSETRFPCVAGEAGTAAVFEYGGTTMFTFPESASNIKNICYVWTGALIHVWFEMQPDDLDGFLESLLWDVQPSTLYSSEPPFGRPRRNATYSTWAYEEHLDGTRIWVDTEVIPYRVYVEAWFD